MIQNLKTQLVRLFDRVIRAVVPKDSGVAHELLKTGLFRHRRRWLFTVVVGQATPMIELMFLGSIYILIGDKARDQFLDWLENIDWLPQSLVSTVVSDTSTVALIVALILLFLYLSLRYAYEINHAIVLYRVALSDSQRIVNAFLSATPAAVSQIGLSKITNAVTQNAGAPGTLLAVGTRMIIHVWSAGVYVAGALLVSWEIVVFAFLLFAFPLWLTRWVYRQMSDIGQLKIVGNQAAFGFLTDMFAGHSRSLVDGLEPHLINRSKGVLRQNFEWRVIKRRIQSRFSLINDGIAMFGLLGILFVGVTKLGLELATLLLLFIVFSRIRGSVSAISSGAIEYANLLPSISLLGEVLNELERAHVDKQKWKCKSFPPIERITLTDVHFAYPGDPKPVLKGINFEAKRGERILIKGPSGEGKTTFFELLSGLLKPDEGEVRYNDQLLDEDSFYRIRQQLAFVSPTVHLFRGSLRDNLKMGFDYSDTKLAKAIHLAGLGDVAQSMPNGLDEDLGENGGFLSLGQRQRVILARLFLKNPSLILLDEATANLDRSLEQQLMGHLDEFINKEAIVIMIAHKEPRGFEYDRAFSMSDGILTEISEEAVDAPSASVM